MLLNFAPSLKNSDPPICLVCEQKRKPGDGLLSFLAAPARHALKSKAISTVEQLSKFRDSERLEIHGVGPSSIPKLRSALEAKGLSFRRENL
jgi:hypothetical protein